jgi:hypothetical protein
MRHRGLLTVVTLFLVLASPALAGATTLTPIDATTALSPPGAPASEAGEVSRVVVSEPPTLALLGLGLAFAAAGIAVLRWRRRRRHRRHRYYRPVEPGSLPTRGPRRPA